MDDRACAIVFLCGSAFAILAPLVHHVRCCARAVSPGELEDELSNEELVVIPLPTNKGGITYAVARLISENGHAFAEAIAAIPETNFAPPRRIALSRYSLAQIRPGAPPHRPDLYLYEGMIMPSP